jgi:site-specific DNA-methyltransferase (adenine-specific)
MRPMKNNDEIYFKNKRVSIFNSNVFEITQIDPDSIDLIVTSPPYNVDIKYNSHNDHTPYEEYKLFSRYWMERCYSWLKDDGRFCLNIPLDKNKGGQQSVGADLTRIAQDVDFKYQTTIVWNEGNISRRTAWGSFQKASAPYVIAPVELIVVFYKKKWKKTSGSNQSTIEKEDFLNWTNGLWTFNGESKKRIGHPAPFPLELPKRCIQLFSYKWDIVLDPFAGSGSTLVEACLNDRIGYGIDIDRDYCALAHSRLQKETEDKLNASVPHRKSTKIQKMKKNRKSYVTQSDVLLRFFRDHPSVPYSYAEIEDGLKYDYRDGKYRKIKHLDRRVRELKQKGCLIRIKDGVYQFNLKKHSH